MFTCWNDLSNFIVMNLDHQTDRLSHMMEELTRIGKTFVRLSASKPGDNVALKYSDYTDLIIDPKLAIGVSELRCLEYAMENELEYIVICEDDIEFKNIELTKKHFDEFIGLKKEWDTICLHAISFVEFQTIEKSYGKLRRHVGLGCMIVNKKYYKTLYDRLLKSIYNLKKGVKNSHNDVLYDIEMRDKWYIILPILCLQNIRKYGCCLPKNYDDAIIKADNQYKLNDVYRNKFPHIKF